MQPEAPAEPVTLDVRAVEALDAEALREALEADLGVEVRLVHDGDARVIVTSDADGRLTLRVRRADGDVLERATDPDAQPARTVTTVSLLVANLVRDESSEVLALLRIERRPEAPEPAEEPPPEEPPAEEPPVEEPPVEEPPPPAPPEHEHIPAAIDFAPFLGFSTASQGGDRRNFALGVLGTLAGRIEGASIAGVVDLTLGDVRGLQLGGITALAGDRVAGLQLGGVVAATTDRVEGLQLGGVVAVAPGGVDGLQLSMVDVAGSVRGAQLGMVNVSADEVLAVQGIQIGLANIAAGETRGAQIGLANVATGPVDGVQVGLVNVASGPVRGLQLGLVNFAERADAAVGLVNVQTAGQVQLRGHVDTNGYLGLTMVHGAGVSRWLLFAAGNPFLAARPGGLAGVGIGFRIEPSELIHLDIETSAGAVLDRALSQRGPDVIGDLRLVLAIRIFDGFAIFGGIGYRLHFTADRTDDVELGAPFGESVLTESATSLLRGWPAIQLGVELF
ncbi:MAG: hypothetical protein R3B82_21160 [Sandaracinaceae bacterium]